MSSGMILTRTSMVCFIIPATKLLLLTSSQPRTLSRPSSVSQLMPNSSLNPFIPLQTPLTLVTLPRSSFAVVSWLTRALSTSATLLPPPTTRLEAVGGLKSPRRAAPAQPNSSSNLWIPATSRSSLPRRRPSDRGVGIQCLSSDTRDFLVASMDVSVEMKRWAGA